MDEDFTDDDSTPLKQGDANGDACQEPSNELEVRRQGNRSRPEAGCSSSSQPGPASSRRDDGRQLRCCPSSKSLRPRTCPIRQHFKLCEKRTLSGSSENLLGDDLLPRKSFKLCRGFIKRWFHGSEKSGRDALEAKCRPTCDYRELQSSFECEEEVAREGGVSSDRGQSGGLSGSCSDLLDELASTCHSTRSKSDGESPGLSAEAAARADSQDRRPAGKGGRDTDKHRGQDCGRAPSPGAVGARHLRLSLLPPLVVAQIFSYLSMRELLRSVSLVCKRWQELAQIPSLWLQIRLRSHTGVADQDLLTLCSRHSSVRLLDLSDCLKITDKGFRSSLAHCKMLSEIFLIRCSQLGVSGFQALADHCCNLTHLDLTGCTGLTDEALTSIAERSPMLQKLRLKQCPLVSDRSLEVVASSCPRLTLLTFKDNDKITDATLEALGNHSHNLEILGLQNCSVASSGLLQITKLRLLCKLDLSKLSNLTDEAVKQVASHCRLIDTLNLSLSSSIGDDCVAHVAASCQKLTNLFLISCNITDKALLSIGDNSRLLEHLDVSWCPDITDQGTVYVSQHCPGLKYLGLIRCSQVSDTAVERMVVDYPGIHYSTFMLDSKRLMDRAKEQGFIMSD